MTRKVQQDRPRRSGGVGLGLRWAFLDEVVENVRAGGPPLSVDFFEVSPENYMRRSGYVPSQLALVAERYPLYSHGLTMSLGGVDPMNDAYFSELRAFVAAVDAPFHSDHLCFGGADGRLVHDLLPLPFIEEAVRHVAQRAREARERLGRPLAVENISYYVRPGLGDMSEAAFVAAVLEEADLGLLLDVNNVAVNAANFGFDPKAFIDALPLERVVAIHVAGHEYRPQHELIIDTHGEDTPNAVLSLLTHVVERTGPVPVILERDNNIPALDALLVEVEKVRAAYQSGLKNRAAA